MFSREASATARKEEPPQPLASRNLMFAGRRGNAMGFRKDLTGKRFGMLIVVSHSHNSARGKSYWVVDCECGTKNKSVAGDNLSSGKTLSCGCLRKSARLTHGASRRGRKTKSYIAWQNMVARCNRESHPQFRLYGARGIKVCDRWLHDFEAFSLDVGDTPSEKHQIDRIDNNGNYEPGNVRWTSASVNAQNRRVISKTGFKGVGKQALTGRWFAHIGVEGMRIYLGTYDSIDAAARAHDMAALKYYGDKVYLNFEDSRKEAIKRVSSY